MKSLLKYKGLNKKDKLGWLIMLVVLVLAIILVFYLKLAGATFVGNHGNIAWGDTSLGRIRLSYSSYSNTSPYLSFGTSFRPTTAPSASAIQFIANKRAPTRTERMLGYELATGALYVGKCINLCSTTTDLTGSTNYNLWHQTVAAANTGLQHFDIAYEQLSGRAMVVYAGNTTGRLYYCIYDGTSWGPVSTCAPTNGSNDIVLTDGTTSLGGTPEWVRLVPQGGQGTISRSNQILLVVGDSNKDYLVTKWTGTAWTTTDRQVLTTTGGSSVTTSDLGSVDAPAYDVGWETTSGLEMAVYANGTALTYRTSSGSGWSAGSSIGTLGAAASWVRLASDPQNSVANPSNRMSLIVAYSTTAQPYIWKGDNSTATWVSKTSLSMAQNVGMNVDTAWLKSNVGTSKAVFVSSANANTTRPDYATWTDNGGTGTFGAWATIAAAETGAVAIVGVELTPSPNSDIISLFKNDTSGRLRAIQYNGSAWGTVVTTNLTTSLIDTTTGRTTGKNYTQKAYQYSFAPYSAFSQNWRVYDDETATGNPSTALAAQDTQATVKPNNIVRLRVGIAEMAGGNLADTRKKLQYSTGAGCPDSSTCSWTDVDVQGGSGTWRYANGGATDDAAVASTTLSGATAVGRYYEDGTSASVDAPAASSVDEYDFTIENHNGGVGVVYYFRAYDFGPSRSGAASRTNLNPIPREQVLSTAGTEQTNCSDGTTPEVCTYPTLYSYTSAPHPPVFQDTPAGSTIPLIQLKSSDDENDYIDYVIEWCNANSWPCSGTGGVFCQLTTAISPVCTGDQTNWSGQDANSGLAYIGNGTIGFSTTASYQVQAGVFLPGTTYYLRAKAIDPGGSNTFSLYSSTIDFTTSAVDILIRGGTCIGTTGTGSACSAQTSRGASTIQIGN